MRKVASLPVGVFLLLLSLGLFSSLPDAAAGDVEGCTKKALTALGDPPIRGKAFLCIEPKGVRAELRVRALTPGNAYTFWFAYVDDPSQCVTPGECSAPADFGGNLPDSNPLGVLGRIDSAVAPRSGRMIFSGRVGGLHLLIPP